MKRILLILLIAISGVFVTAQTFPFNNEWIDYSKTYYKFYVGKTGLYRIPQAVLASNGIGSIPAEQFQLWRNGREVPLYTSVPSGPLSGSDFIEFWGEWNDGLPDSTLYRDSDFILSSKYSFQSDTAAFFLTVNPAGGNRRLQSTINNVAGNILPRESYFMFTEGIYFHEYLNGGYYVDAGEFVHSSSYDKGEGWVCVDIYAGQSRNVNHTLYPYASGPAATFSINAAGNSNNPRRFKVKLNADSIFGTQMDYLDHTRSSVSVSLSTLLNGANTIEITNQSLGAYDRMVVAQYELTYPRVFNFGNNKNFQFVLPANPAGNYLEITNFNYGSTAPVLYDITNGKRYIGDISNPALLKFALDPSMVNREFVLISLEPSNIATIGSMKQRNFINYNLAAYQGDYLIISHSQLYAGPGGSNPVDDYRVYRGSSAGGAYNAKIYEIDELVDQFAFGIKKHPNSVRNFLRWTRANFSTAPKFVFLIGRGMVYDQYNYAERSLDPNIERLNIVPTFGMPASDILLSADVRQQIPLTPIGRLSVIDGGEVAIYLAKVKEYETAQTISSPLIQDKAWTKNVVHVIGGNEPALVTQLNIYMNKYKQIISDTLFGGNVTTFKKSSTETIQALSDQRMKDLFAEGINQVTYFGHSSATVLDFNLDNPEQYNNPGKYPLFVAMGCLAGNFFNNNPARFYTKETLSEKWLLAPNRGAIAFIASSHFGIPHYLDIYNVKIYNNEARAMYGRTYGEIMKQSVIDVLAQTSDFYSRMHTEENILHGDPAIRPNNHLKPDYVIEDPMVKVSPSFISVADTVFKIDAKYLNQGRAVNKDISIKVERKLPGGNFFTVFNDTIPGIRYEDSVSVILHINPTTDQGLNQIRVTIDADNAVDESWENNNTITKDVFIFEDDARPVYPLNSAIINKQNIKLYASTANPFSPSKQYRMEMDTTTFFNSSFKRTVNVTAVGGLLEFNPAITFTDSTVYYWRVSAVDGAGNPSKWNEASFVYLPNSDVGFNQSHFYQHIRSFSERVFIDSTNRTWKYHPVLNNLFIRSGQYPTSSPNAADYNINVNGENRIGPGCNYNELIINVFDPISFQPIQNINGNLYDSYNCQGMAYNREFNFHYSLGDTAGRRKARDFLQNIVPDGAYVAIRSNTAPYPGYNTYASVWQADAAYYGQNTLYNTLKDQGFTSIDNYDTTNSFAFVYKKNNLATYTPSIKFAENIYDRLLLSVACPTPDTLGYTTSPAFGAAKQWKQLKWRGSTVDLSAGDQPTVDIIGIDNAGIETTIMSGLNTGQQDVDISMINAAQYPFLKLRMRNLDSINLTPYQLRYWRLTYVPVPEGALTPNVFFQFRDTLNPGEPLDFKVAFKNISDANFDSLKIKLILTDRNNVQKVISPSSKFKPLISGDTLHVRNPIPTAGLSGLNTFYLDVNPDNDQPEQFHFNNFMYRTFYVTSDKVNPLLDVTFDGVHILNRDIVASKPHITIKLKDENKWLLLNDTAGAQIQVRYPNGVKRSYFFNTSDTLKFTPPGNSSNADNTATIDFLPYFPLDGDYELTVTGKDRSGNTAGNIEYKVGFQVINKPMISNMLNYPNPFTTSTAFVFTITGAEVPQNIRIQIMTITGKIVREITKDELGPLHIGRNITEFKWDGTDQYGQKLANGIYLYRVITNLNGKSLDKYRSTEKDNEDNTDKYFNKGYGKMYLMR